MELRNSSSAIRNGRIISAAAALFFVGATVGRTGAAFTASQLVDSSVASGRVELDAGGVQRLTFGGADLTAIGPGTNLSQTITVTNASTVAVPNRITDIVLWADTSSAPADVGGLAAALQVTITRSIGGGSAATLYSGSLAGLSSYSSYATPIGAIWTSENGGSTTGSVATRATYTFTFSLPSSSSSGANSTAGISFVFEARNRTS